MKFIIHLLLFILISSCTFNKVVKHHGVHFLEKKHKKLLVNTTNRNDPEFKSAENEAHFYRVKFPNDYQKGSLEVTKFEKNLDSRRQTRTLTYKFVNCFPLSINSMPISYDGSQLLKCTVSMAYSRYFIEDRPLGVIPRFINALFG